MLHLAKNGFFHFTTSIQKVAHINQWPKCFELIRCLKLFVPYWLICYFHKFKTNNEDNAVTAFCCCNSLLFEMTNSGQYGLTAGCCSTPQLAAVCSLQFLQGCGVSHIGLGLLHSYHACTQSTCKRCNSHQKIIGYMISKSSINRYLQFLNAGNYSIRYAQAWC